MNLSSFRSRLIGGLLGLLTVSAARAQFVSVNLSVGQLYDASGVKLNTGGLVLLIADTSRNGFGSLLSGSSLSAGSFLNTDDQILGSATILPNFTGSAMGSFTSIPLESGAYSTLNSGDPLAVVWFSTLTGSSTTLVGGASYGVFSSTSATVDGAPWTVPAEGALANINFRTILGGGTHAETEAYASYTVSAIPEPSTYAAIAGALMLGVAVVRRRKVVA